MHVTHSAPPAIDWRQWTRRWLAAARPRTLPLAVTPVLAGILLALAESGRLAPLTALGTLLAAIAIQIGTNLHNDAADFERGTDTAHRVGPARAAASGWFSPAALRRATHLAFSISLLCGIALVVRGGWPILVLGLVAIAAGYAYTGGPRPIAYGPHGELYVLTFFGIAAVAGTYYLQTLNLSATAITLGIALGLPAAAVLLLNNYRDFDSDRAAGRRTLCHLLGRPAARALYAALLLVPLPLLAWGGLPASGWPLWLALPLALRPIAPLWGGADGADLNPLLWQTSVYQASLVLLLGLGMLLGT
ncbi:MAG: 1,4-dihydroxy-2-naphthoate octaprenyltransferase [Chromatiaceae bacterium]|nr:MAG: 1,4-dihydroxy-2-naphthoate octaprenyltransferase [Chromatiaceae bacterium]